MSSGGRQRSNPAEAALARLADLAGRGVTASRMVREVETLVAGWRGGERAATPEEVAERLAVMHEQLVAGASAAAEQVSDVEADEPAALRHAKLVQAALDAAVEAVAQAIQRPAPAQDVVPTPKVMPPPAPVPVTIDPLAGRNPQGLHLSHPEELRAAGEAAPVSASKPAKEKRAPAKRGRKSSKPEEKSLYA